MLNHFLIINHHLRVTAGAASLLTLNFCLSSAKRVISVTKGAL